jgi:hypothetical protein
MQSQINSGREMLIARLDRKVVGAPIKVGTSKGGLHAFVVGAHSIILGGTKIERLVVFIDQNPSADSIPGLEQLLSIDQLIRFSQPNAWEFDEEAIAHAKQQLKAA